MSGMARAEGTSTTIDMIWGDPANINAPGRIVFTVDVADSGFQATPQQYEIWLAQQIQAEHDVVRLSSDLRAINDAVGDLQPGFWRQTSPDVYVEVSENQAGIIVEGNGPNRTATFRAILDTVKWLPSESRYNVTQQKTKYL